ncbi:hypothetical protein [Pseudomonas aegrilactucae]|uniref:Uncharacterized protein n=1 Tax=Pseudomonas aegrilactucae TaxID=2854028 RepID=A0A9Q2XLE7_9PSED|nr:hypothetical protein [Pseudomonas aegrilactucae]MBV6288838.1 hypothetical protein [Pseudomonas aegrilactucae]
MRGKSLGFFATKSDMFSLVEAIDATSSINITQAGEVVDGKLTVFSRLVDVPGLGVSSHPTSVLNDFYLICKPGVAVSLRKVSTKQGGVRYILDQKENLGTLVFRPGGEYFGEGIIVSEVSTIYQSGDGLDLFKLFEKKIKGNFKKNSLLLCRARSLRGPCEGY